MSKRNKLDLKIVPNNILDISDSSINPIYIGETVGDLDLSDLQLNREELRDRNKLMAILKKRKK